MFKALHTLRQEPARATMAQETAGEVYTLVREGLYRRESAFRKAIIRGS